MGQPLVTSLLNKGLILFIFCLLVCLRVTAQSGWKTNKDGRLKYEYKPGPGYIAPTKSPTTSPGTTTATKTKLQLAETKYDWTGNLYGNREKVVKGSRYGFVDGNGVEVIPLSYTDADNFSEGLAAVKKDGHWGYINEYGSTIFEFTFSSAGAFKNGKATVTENGVSKELNRFAKSEPEKVAEKDPDLAFHEGLACVKINGKWGFQDEGGTMIVPAIYDVTLPFKKGLGAVQSGLYWGFVDRKGKMIIPARYTSFFHVAIAANLLAVKKTDKYGFIDFKGVTVIPFIYDMASLFGTGTDKLIDVKLNGKWGCINAKGIIIVSLKYDRPLLFWKGYAQAVSSNKYGIVDHNGKIVTPLIYESIQWDANGIFGKLGVKTVEIKLPIIADAK